MTKRLSIDKIDPDPKQPRKNFDPADLEALAATIKANGLIQPISVRPRGNGRYWLVAGERRWRAHRLLRARGLRYFAKIECNVRPRHASKADIRIKQIVENIARADLEPLEEARAFAQLVEDFDMTPEEIAARLGLAPFRVRWRLQLLNLSLIHI